MNENKLFPFMVKGQIEISNRNNIEGLNNVSRVRHVYRYS